MYEFHVLYTLIDDEFQSGGTSVITMSTKNPWQAHGRGTAEIHQFS